MCACLSVGVRSFLHVCACLLFLFVCWHEYAFVCVCACLGEDALHGAGQRPRRGSGSGQSVTADPTVRSSSGEFSICNVQQHRNFFFFFFNRSKH